VDLLEELEVGDNFLVAGDDVFVFDTDECVAVFEVAVGVLSRVSLIFIRTPARWCVLSGRL
jgi:hypothetical protein